MANFKLPLPASWHGAAWLAALGLLVFFLIASDLSALRAAERFSQEGSPPPERDASSHTGYVNGQRAFLAMRHSGETYRWIARAQELIDGGLLSSDTYLGDTTPVGRPQLLPQAYAAWLVAVAWSLHLVTEDPLPIAIEAAALWEPLVAQTLVLIGAAFFMWRRFGPASAGLTAALFVFAPWIANQFVPGTLGARPWSLAFAAYAIAISFCRDGAGRRPSAFGWNSALALSASLWLDPALGFPAALIASAAGAGRANAMEAPPRFLKWASIGAAATTLAWAIDGAHWDLSAGELRFAHPLYAAAWLGLGLMLDGYCRTRRAEKTRKGSVARIAVGLGLVAALAVAQIDRGYWGWLYPSPALLRLTPLEETPAFPSVADWIGHAPLSETLFVAFVPLAALAALAVSWVAARRDPAGSPVSHAAASAALLAALLLACFRIHWAIGAVLISAPILAGLAAWLPRFGGRMISAAAAIYLMALAALPHLSGSANASETEGEATRPQLTALVYRHFSHWLATRAPGSEVRVLASPDLSDSLVFHGGCQALMSTAWESHPGMVAATRILSAPESTEAEAVIQSRELTHIALTSWENVLPLLAKAPNAENENTFYHRLQHWVLPPYLRPIPYRLPPAPGFAHEKLVLFELTPHQDDALALSRLAEYFVEMERHEPAGLAAEALAKSFPTDPNAAIARAFVHAQAKDSRAFQQELKKLEADAEAGRIPYDWDRRALRAIVLAMGKQDELAKRELQACVATMTDDSLSALTPLQAFRLRALMRLYRLSFPSAALEKLSASLSSEYNP